MKTSIFWYLVCGLLLAGSVQVVSAEGGYAYSTQWSSPGPGDGQFNLPRGVAVDISGNIYVADRDNQRIQKFDSSGTFITKWGSEGSEDGQFNYPQGVAVDSAGNVYVADTRNDRIQTFTSNGTFISTWGSSGSGDGQFDGPGAIAVDSTGYVYITDRGSNRVQKFTSNGTFVAKWGSGGSEDGQLNWPAGVAVDSAGTVYISDSGNRRIQKFDQNGTFITSWGGSFGSGDGQFTWPGGVAVDGTGDLYVTDLNNNRVQKFDSNGGFITKWGSEGSGDGQFHEPQGIAVDSAGNVYVTETGNRVQKFDSNGRFITKWGSYASRDGQFSSPEGITVDGIGTHCVVYVADTGNDRIQEFTPDGTFITKWGGWGGHPSDLALDSRGNVYVPDTGNDRILKIDPSPTGAPGVIWGSSGSGDGQVDRPSGIEVDYAGIYVVDSGNDRVQIFDGGGVFLQKWGGSGSGNGQFNQPRGIAAESVGTIFVADSGNNRIQKFDSAGTFITTWGTAGSGNGQFSQPVGVAVDSAGNVFVADSGNNRIQKFDSNGTFITAWGSAGSGDGQFDGPKGVGVDGAGNVYVADTGNNRIQKFAPVATPITTPGVTPSPDPHRPYNGPHNVPGLIEAEDYDPYMLIGYSDTTAGNEGGAYRDDDVDIEAGGQNYDVGWIIGGEFLTYSVDAALTGDYTIAIRAANPDATAKTVTVVAWRPEQTDRSSTTVTIPSTGSFDTYGIFTSTGTLSLKEGRNIVKLTFNASRINLDSIRMGINTPQTLQAAFTVNTETVPVGQPVIGTDMSVGNPTSWSWNFGDGTTAVSRNVNHQYWSAGSYTLSLKVTNGSRTSTASRTIIVSPGVMTADFLVETTPGSSLVRITDASVNATTVRYDLGDGTTTTNRNFQYTYWQPGTYTITLIATNVMGSLVRKVQVTVPAVPTTLIPTNTTVIPTVTTGFPYNGPHNLPGLLQAEDYDLGGEGVAYHDTSSGNEGGAYRQDDVDIETAGGITDIGWIRDGEYLAYTVNVTRAGTYAVSARVASPNSGRTVAISIDGRSRTTIPVPNTGSFDIYMTATPPTMYADLPPQTPIPGPTGVSFPAPISLTAGTHVLNLTFQGDGQNLDWIAFTPFVTPTPMP